MCSKMEDCTEKREKVTSTNKRNNKPLMEKRRRQRINDCLVQLKSLVLQAMNKDTTQYSKLEKADILEMTVKHLKLVQRHHLSGSMANDPNSISKYRAGFNDCAAEIARYLDNVNGGNPQLKARVMSYLGNSMLQFPVIPVYQGIVSPYQVQMKPSVTPQSYHTPGYPQMTSFPPQYPMTSHVSSCETYPHHPQSNSPVKIEPADNDVFSSRVTMDTTSYNKRVPSPCDSDSGLSDISTSVSHDENGNYTNFTSQRGRHDDERPAATLTLDPRKRCLEEMRTSPKRKEFRVESLSPVKRVKHEHDNMRHEPARDLQARDPMWRPW